MWNERYRDAFAAYGTKPNDYLRQEAAKLPRGPIACLAEGEGRNAVFLAELGHDVTAIDSSEVGLENAKQLAASRGVEIKTIVADLNDFDLGDEQWAGIVSVWAHLPKPNRAELHRRCVRALRSGGVLLLEGYTPRQLERPGRGGPPNAINLMEPRDLREELLGLDILHCDELDRDVQEGEFHRGLSATVQLLAQKL